ncbi:MAG: hypothetical protein Kow0069_08780 [Promethearchaeota archaeon]
MNAKARIKARKKGLGLAAAFVKELKSVARGPTKVTAVLCLAFPALFILFMWMVFGAARFDVPVAVVVSGYESDAELEEALDRGELPETRAFLESLDDDSVAGATIVKCHVAAVGASEALFEEALVRQDYSLLVVLPPNFEASVAAARSGDWTGGPVNVTLRVLDVNEDYAKNLLFVFERRLKAYLEDNFPGAIRASYEYFPAVPGRPSYPRMWTLSSAAVVYAILVSSMMLGASLVFAERDARMFPILALASRRSRAAGYSGKFLASVAASLGTGFPFGLFLAIAWEGVPPPAHPVATLAWAALASAFGAAVGLVFGSVVPELVFCFPVAGFTALASLFTCGGFADVELFPASVQAVVRLVPFTYCFAGLKASLLPGTSVPAWYPAALAAGTVAVFAVGFRLFERLLKRPAS